MNNKEKKDFVISSVHTCIPVRERLGDERWHDGFITEVMRKSSYNDARFANPDVSYTFVTDNGLYALFDENISINGFALADFFNRTYISLEEWYSDILGQQVGRKDMYRRDDNMRVFCYHNTDFGRHYACR